MLIHWNITLKVNQSAWRERPQTEVYLFSCLFSKNFYIKSIKEISIKDCQMHWKATYFLDVIFFLEYAIWSLIHYVTSCPLAIIITVCPGSRDPFYIVKKRRKIGVLAYLKWTKCNIRILNEISQIYVASILCNRCTFCIMR